LAYIFDQERNTFIDDEDKSLGNKLALIDNDELEKAIKQIDEQFGPGTTFPASELPPKENPYKDFEDRNPAANGGMMRQNYENGAEVMTLNPLFPTRDIESQDFQPIDVPGAIIPPLAIGAGAKRLSDIFFSKDEDESKELEIIEEDKKDPDKKPPEDPFEPDTFLKIKELTDAYRETKTRKKGVTTSVEADRGIRERVKPASNQPIMTIDEKTELTNIVINKFKELEGRLPTATELKNLPGTKQISNLSNIIRDKKIKLPKGKTGDYNRTDPSYVQAMENKFQSKAIERNTITNFGNKSFFPNQIELPNGDVVDAKNFFESNFAQRVKLGPGREETKALTLTNKQLAKLFNTNVRKIEKATKILKDSPDFKVDYPEPRPVSYGQQQALKRLKEARKYVTESELTNIKIQEKERINLNTMFRTGELVVTDYPNLVKAVNTTLDKETGILDHTIKKTDKQMIERSKHNTGLFDISHTIEKTSGQKNIEFLINRNVAPSKINQGLFKSFTAYVKNQKDKPDYEERLSDFDKYLKEMGLRIKVENRFFGLDGKMFDSNTGEHTGINRTLDYFGLPKFESGVPLTKVKKASGGPIQLSSMPRVDFNGGGAVGADNNFAKELEYFLLNPDAELPKADSYRETMNPVALLNDMIDPRNYAYYADRLAETGVRVAEFGARVLPALGQLTADLIQKPAFKFTGGTNQGYVQEYTDIPPSNIKGTGIFSEFLDNLVGSEGTKVITEKTGIADLIRSEEQKQKDRRSTIGPKVLADQVTLGAELTAPIFPGLKLLKAYAKNRKLPVNDTTKEVMDKEIDEVLATQNLTRRDFLKATGAGSAIVLAKMLGFGDELATTTKVVEKATKEAATGGVPPYFLNLVKKIKTMGDETMATKDKATAYKYDDYYMEEDFAGNIEITRKGDMDVPGYEEVYMSYRIDEVPIKGKEGSRKVEEYEEYTARPDEDGKMKDVEDGVPDDVIEEGTMFEDNIAEFGK